MLGFGKKRKNRDKNRPEADKKQEQPQAGASVQEKKKKKFSIKKIIVILLIFICMGIGGYLGYSFFFSSKISGSPARPAYKKIQLTHIKLPDEMIRFCFDYFPDLYADFITFNTQMNLLDSEIKRIDAIGKRYPDQKKIADKEKKVWEKTRNALAKAFTKIEKPVKETFVLFQVNQELGLARIKEQKKQLAGLAETALAPALEITAKLRQKNKAPKGFIKGTIYKLKKKFL